MQESIGEQEWTVQVEGVILQELLDAHLLHLRLSIRRHDHVESEWFRERRFSVVVGEPHDGVQLEGARQ